MDLLKFRRAGFVLLLLSAQVAAAQDATPSGTGDAGDALLRPGDQIALRFFRDPELNSAVTVNERGEAAFPKLGLFSVSQWSIAQLQDTLRSRYAVYLRAPEFEISVLRRVVVNGEVKMPNVYMVDAATTLRDVLARAGGLTEYGSRSKVSVIRGDERMPVRDWDRNVGGAFALQSGDQVVVGRKNWFAINALSVVSTGILVATFVITASR